MVTRLGGFHIARKFPEIHRLLHERRWHRGTLDRKWGLQKGNSKQSNCRERLSQDGQMSYLSEAMVGLAWDAFEEWTLAEGRHDLDFGDSLDNLYESLLHKDPASALNSCTAVKATLQEIISIWKEFIDSLGVTAKYWLMYVDMLSILKRFIKAERAGKCMEHLAEIQHMLPYIVIAKHTNDVSCLPIYLREMRDLEEKHPAVYNNFIRGRFTVHRTEGRFNCVWTDMALE